MTKRIQCNSKMSKIKWKKEQKQNNNIFSLLSYMHLPTRTVLYKKHQTYELGVGITSARPSVMVFVMPPAIQPDNIMLFLFSDFRYSYIWHIAFSCFGFNHNLGVWGGGGNFTLPSWFSLNNSKTVRVVTLEFYSFQ